MNEQIKLLDAKRIALLEKYEAITNEVIDTLTVGELVELIEENQRLSKQIKLYDLEIQKMIEIEENNRKITEKY